MSIAAPAIFALLATGRRFATDLVIKVGGTTVDENRNRRRGRGPRTNEFT